MSLPPLSHLVDASEFTLSLDQELRLFDDRTRRTRFWAAPHPTAPPRATTCDGALTAPWLIPWVQLNEPATDDMVGVAILAEDDPGTGALVFARPTPEVCRLWQAYTEANLRSELPVPVSIGAEAALDVPEPAVDYRAVFRYTLPLPPLADDTVRFAFRRPPGSGRLDPGWQVVSSRGLHRQVGR
jgi:hypothetical protein